MLTLTLESLAKEVVGQINITENAKNITTNSVVILNVNSVYKIMSLDLKSSKLLVLMYDKSYLSCC